MRAFVLAFSRCSAGRPLAATARVAGAARLKLALSWTATTPLTPLLVDVAPDGTTKTVSRGF